MSRRERRRSLLVIGVLGIGLVCIGAVLALRSHDQASLRLAADPRAATAATPSVLLQQAAIALAANRLTEPSGNNALELYLRELSLDPGSSAARAGLAEVRERLYARAQVALLEERLDPAAAAIETARKAGVESGRIALLNAELGKARDEAKIAAARRGGQDRPGARCRDRARRGEYPVGADERSERCSRNAGRSDRNAWRSGCKSRRASLDCKSVGSAAGSRNRAC